MAAADRRLDLGSGGTLGAGCGRLTRLHLHVVLVDVLGGLHHALGEVETATPDSRFLRLGRPPIDEGAHDGDVSDDAFLPQPLLVLLLQVQRRRLDAWSFGLLFEMFDRQ